jgi:hypothetical protein
MEASPAPKVDQKALNIFHRTGQSGMSPTDQEKHVEKIKTGFNPSSGDAYGAGLYGADWATQMGGNADNMLGYGPILIHYVAKPKGYLIFDYRLSKRLYGGSYTLEDQLINYGAYSRKDMPTFLSVMSEDLEDTLKYPRISADRARWLADYFYRNRRLDLSKLDYAPPDSIKKAYWPTTGTFQKSPFNAKIKSGVIKGMVFSGNWDGNVIVTYPPSFKKLVYAGWCLVKGATIIKPWDYEGANQTADGIQGMYQDGVQPLIGNNPNKTIASIDYSVPLTKNNVDSAIATTIKSLAWLKNPLARFKDLEIVVTSDGTSDIRSGNWMGGDFFGNCSDLVHFIGGNFLGDTFNGYFDGGTFSSGCFTGFFRGGVYEINKKTKWGASAEINGVGSKAIKVNGKTYPWMHAETPEKEWKLIQDERIAKLTGAPAGIQDLPEYIKIKLGYDCVFKIDDDWEKNQTNENKFLKFKKDFAWLFNVRKWGEAPNIHLSSKQIALTKGELVVGTLYFDYYSEDVVIRGGQISGKNIFKGKFRGGIYAEGKFEGQFFGGIFNLDNAAWTKSAEAKPPKIIKETDVNFIYSVIFKKKIYKIPREVLMFEEKGKRPYQDIGIIQNLLSTGKWANIVVMAKQAMVTAGAKSNRFRGDDELVLDSAETDVPDWAEDETGGSNVQLTIPEAYKGDKRTMAGLMYEFYRNGDKQKKGLSLFETTFGYSYNESGIPSIANLLEKQDYSETPINSFISCFDESEVAYAMTKLLGLNEKIWRFDDLDDQEQEVLYSVFRDTYVKATGAAFDKNDFDWRASNWTFFGEPPNGTSNEASVGGIAVRKQMSNNMYKLVASFGNFRGALKGFGELKQKANGASVWGIVDETIKKLIIKHDKDFVAPPGIVVKTMEAGIKKLSNGEVQSVGLDGSMQVNTPAGIMKKYFVANKDYIRWLLDSISDPANASRLPVPQAVLTPLIGVIQKLL